MSLEDHIKKMIEMCGPIDVATYMQECLAHPEFGYYIVRDPIGLDGDFVTAPEISQMFGEMIGAWVADLWQRLEKPAFTLLECGPGRGTLMADLLRVCEKVPGFIDHASIHFLETSPELKKRQKETLKDFEITWHQDMMSLPKDKPIICIANEFLDALPVRHLIKDDKGWMERRINTDETGKLSYTTLKADDDILDFLPEFAESMMPGDIVEISPDRLNWLLFFAQMIKDNTGIALFIDYGYDKPDKGETFQAIQRHEFVNPLEQPGQADLTAHVDFSMIELVASQSYLSTYGPVSQCDFLGALGIQTRAQNLSNQVDDKQKKQIEQDLKRLIDRDHMGELFKVMAFANQAFPKPEGF